VARSCLTVRCDRAKVLAGCTVSVKGKFVGDFGEGLYLAILWGFFDEYKREFCERKSMVCYGLGLKKVVSQGCLEENST